jgi:putative ABC transport system permease protein
MIALQFMVAIVVFAGALLIDKQVNFFFQKDLGYQKDMVVTSRLHGTGLRRVYSI